VQRQADRREVHEPGRAGVVDARHGDPTGHVDPAPAQAGHEPDRDLVVDRQHRVRKDVVQQPLGGGGARLVLEAARELDRIGARRRHRRLEALQPLRARVQLLGAAHERDPPVAERQEVLGDLACRRGVVDQHARTREVARRQRHHRAAARLQRVHRGRELRRLRGVLVAAAREHDAGRAVVAQHV
jgi:hypothetical protein